MPALPTAGSVEIPSETLSRGALVLRRFLRNRLGVTSTAVLVLLFAAAFLAPVFYPWDHRAQDDLALLAAPSPAHWFGTNQLGEDLFAGSMRGL